MSATVLKSKLHDNVIVGMATVCKIIVRQCSTGHPRRYPVGTKLGRESQTCRAHGKVADEIPDEGEKLYDTEKER